MLPSRGYFNDIQCPDDVCGRPYCHFGHRSRRKPVEIPEEETSTAAPGKRGIPTYKPTPKSELEQRNTHIPISYVPDLAFRPERNIRPLPRFENKPVYKPTPINLLSSINTSLSEHNEEQKEQIIDLQQDIAKHEYDPAKADYVMPTADDINFEDLSSEFDQIDDILNEEDTLSENLSKLNDDIKKEQDRLNLLLQSDALPGDAKTNNEDTATKIKIEKQNTINGTDSKEKEKSSSHRHKENKDKLNDSPKKFSTTSNDKSSSNLEKDKKEKSSSKDRTTSSDKSTSNSDKDKKEKSSSKDRTTSSDKSTSNSDKDKKEKYSLKDSTTSNDKFSSNLDKDKKEKSSSKDRSSSKEGKEKINSEKEKSNSKEKSSKEKTEKHKTGNKERERHRKEEKKDSSKKKEDKRERSKNKSPEKHSRKDSISSEATSESEKNKDKKKEKLSSETNKPNKNKEKEVKKEKSSPKSLEKRKDSESSETVSENEKNRYKEKKKSDRSRSSSSKSKEDSKEKSDNSKSTSPEKSSKKDSSNNKNKDKREKSKETSRSQSNHKERKRSRSRSNSKSKKEKKSHKDKNPEKESKKRKKSTDSHSEEDSDSSPRHKKSSSSMSKKNKSKSSKELKKKSSSSSSRLREKSKIRELPQKSPESDFAEADIHMSDLDIDFDDEVDTMEECYRIFNEYSAEEKTQVKEDISLDTGEEKPEQCDDSSFSLLAKKRVAHPNAETSKPYAAPRPKECKVIAPTPGQIMANRYKVAKLAQADHEQESIMNEVRQITSVKTVPSLLEAARLHKLKRMERERLKKERESKPSSNVVDEILNGTAKKPTVAAVKVAPAKKINAVPNVALIEKAKERIAQVRRHREEPAKTIAQTQKGGRVAHIPQVSLPDIPDVLQAASSKLPVNVRTRFLTLLAEECFKLYCNKQDAYDRALNEEFACYEKCKVLTTYRNSAMLAVNRLRKEIQERQGKNLGPLLAGESTQADKTSDFKGKRFYENVKRWLLTEEELELHGYPRESGERGRAVILCEKKVEEDFSLVDENQRKCCRCSRIYQVDDDGWPLYEEDCMYHPLKKRTIRGQQVFLCCKSTDDTGCMTSDSHVSEAFQNGSLDGYQTTMPSERDNDPRSVAVYALDCEMCYTTKGLELTRVTIVDTDCKTVYESLVKPLNPIIDYNTQFSGITKDQMERTSTNILQVQANILHLCNADTILVGHSLESDMKALKIVHSSVIDTAVLFPHKMGLPYKRALRSLASEFLRKIIQNDVGGHDSAEDAVTCMELIKWKLKEELKLPMK